MQDGREVLKATPPRHGTSRSKRAVTVYMEPSVNRKAYDLALHQATSMSKAIKLAVEAHHDAQGIG